MLAGGDVLRLQLPQPRAYRCFRTHLGDQRECVDEQSPPAARRRAALPVVLRSSRRTSRRSVPNTGSTTPTMPPAPACSASPARRANSMRPRVVAASRSERTQLHLTLSSVLKKVASRVGCARGVSKDFQYCRQTLSASRDCEPLDVVAIPSSQRRKRLLVIVMQHLANELSHAPAVGQCVMTRPDEMELCRSACALPRIA